MSDLTRPLPKELEPLREWLFQRRPYKDQTLEELLAADTSVYINPSRAIVETAFQDSIAMLAELMREGKVKVVRHRRSRPVARPEPNDPEVRWPTVSTPA